MVLALKTGFDSDALDATCEFGTGSEPTAFDAEDSTDFLECATDAGDISAAFLYALLDSMSCSSSAISTSFSSSVMLDMTVCMSLTMVGAIPLMYSQCSPSNSGGHLHPL